MPRRTLTGNLIEAAQEHVAEMVAQWEEEYGGLTRSPIEAGLFLAIVTKLWLYGENYYVVTTNNDLLKHLAQNDLVFVIWPQAPFEQYTVDILIYSKCRDNVLRTVVECDGHDFHEKTKEQAAHDKARDRTMTIRQSRVIRFTGSEIFNRPFDCAEDVYAATDPRV